MPFYIKKIEGVILDTYLTEASFVTELKAELQFEDYVNLNNFIAFLQNFKQVESIEKIEKPFNIGLKNQFNLETITLEISY